MNPRARASIASGLLASVLLWRHRQPLRLTSSTPATNSTSTANGATGGGGHGGRGMQLRGLVHEPYRPAPRSAGSIGTACNAASSSITCFQRGWGSGSYCHAWTVTAVAVFGGTAAQRFADKFSGARMFSRPTKWVSGEALYKQWPFLQLLVRGARQRSPVRCAEAYGVVDQRAASRW